LARSPRRDRNFSVETAEEARTILRSLTDNEMFIRNEVRAVEVSLRRFDESAPHMIIRDEQDKEWRDNARRSRVAAITEAQARLDRVIERKARHQHSANADLLSSIETWLRRIDPSQIEPAPVAAVKLSKGSTPAAAIEAARERLKSLRAVCTQFAPRR
jgi:hypothetical protein